MRISHRPLLPAERAQRFRDIYFYERAKRRAARSEVETGTAEVLELEVERAWNLITCAGPPCCPNGWLVLTTSGEFVYLESWRFLTAIDGAFPSSKVEVSRFPETHRILSVTGTGGATPAYFVESLSDRLLSEYPECEVLDESQLPAEFLATVRHRSRPVV